MPADRPRLFIQHLLRDRYGINEVLPKNPPAGWYGERSKEVQLTAALLDLCLLLLTTDDREIDKWREKYRGKTTWKVQDCWNAAAMVTYVRAIGYGRERACQIVQDKMHSTLKGKGSLYRTLTRANENHMFDGQDKPFGWPSRDEARTVLERFNFELDDGPNAEKPADDDAPLW